MLRLAGSAVLIFEGERLRHFGLNPAAMFTSLHTDGIALRRPTHQCQPSGSRSIIIEAWASSASNATLLATVRRYLSQALTPSRGKSPPAQQWATTDIRRTEGCRPAGSASARRTCAGRRGFAGWRRRSAAAPRGRGDFSRGSLRHKATAVPLRFPRLCQRRDQRDAAVNNIQHED